LLVEPETDRDAPVAVATTARREIRTARSMAYPRAHRPPDHENENEDTTGTTTTENENQNDDTTTTTSTGATTTGTTTTESTTSSTTTQCKPGNGFGDKNHCHSGPPGHKKHHNNHTVKH